MADNASTDESLQIAVGFTELPISIVQLGRNAGYATGINAGIAAVGDPKPDAVLVMNPDCQLKIGALAVLAEALSVNGRESSLRSCLIRTELCNPRSGGCPPLDAPSPRPFSAGSGRV